MTQKTLSEKTKVIAGSGRGRPVKVDFQEANCPLPLIILVSITTHQTW